MNHDKVIYPQLSYQVMEAVFEVHNTLGPGFVEPVYENALVYEFQLREIPFEKQKIVPVSYKGKVVGKHLLDLVVQDQIALELKAVSDLTNVFKQQLHSYLKAADLRLGILINFGTPRVQSVRIAN